MTLEEIEQRVAYIAMQKDDPEVAHSCEDDLHIEFIQYVASLDISLAAKAKAVLKTLDIE